MLAQEIPDYFRNRRASLMKAHPDGVFLFPANSHPIRNVDVYYPFRQESCFHYLTGWDEPNSFLVLCPNTSSPGQGFKTLFFVAPRDPEKEIWEGERYGVEGALKIFGADEAYPIDELDQRIIPLLQKAEKLFFHSEDLRMNLRFQEWVEKARRLRNRGGAGFSPVFDSHPPIAEMRLFKSKEEVKLMRKSCEISAKAHQLLMREVRPGMNEREAEALIDCAFRQAGSTRLAYGSIAASGKNAACLHYHTNNDSMKEEIFF